MAAWPKPYFRASRSLLKCCTRVASILRKHDMARKIGAVKNYIAFSYVVLCIAVQSRYVQT